MNMLLQILTYGIPIILAITLHEAAHGYVSLHFGDDTAKRLGRVSLNPLRHIDLIGTILVPGFLLLIGSPILFGYAKPVPINFSRLNNPRRDSIYVAAAGPLMNILLAFISALLIHLVVFFPHGMEVFLIKMLEVSVFVNALLAIFNLLPILPLDGGRIVAGLLPERIAASYSRLEPYGLVILIGLLVIPTLFGFNVLEDLLTYLIKPLEKLILFLAGLS